ncbi:lipoprotein [Planoprotostelium fungivorum]|uniref:Lipoprotein n=1 Tax=Planoprotostelium fungivorum TaxID=1890364 RepID=A0A2P6NMZ7_9EUKA|nr:lipoprotein [Planoprotostelium fungivorum]
MRSHTPSQVSDSNSTLIDTVLYAVDFVTLGAQMSAITVGLQVWRAPLSRLMKVKIILQQPSTRASNMRYFAIFVLLSLATVVLSDIQHSHGRLFPVRLLGHQIEELIERDLNFTLGLLHLLPFRKRAGSARVLTPSQLRTIYNVPGGANAGSGQTVAVVVAYGASTAESDLAAFSSRYGLPSCTTANGCFKKVDQNGGTNIPADDTTQNGGWSLETNLDLQTIHSVAPYAKIVLVCAKSAGSDLYTAVKTAAGLSSIVSMSWGGAEGSSVYTYSENIFTSGHTNGVSFFASTGDDGQKSGYPSMSPNVVAVGGTTTYTNTDGSLASESAWSGTGGGCSAVYSMSTAQKTNSLAVSKCGSKRATPDIAFDADPNTGVTVYYSGSWYTVGGTSLATPISSGRTAAVKASSGGAVFDASYFYSSQRSYRDVTTGSNANYNAGTGYDLTTGLGVWLN